MTALIESTQGNGLLLLAFMILCAFFIFVVSVAVAVTRSYRNQVEPYTKKSITNDEDYVLALAWMDYNTGTPEYDKMDKMVKTYERRKDKKHV